MGGSNMKSAFSRSEGQNERKISFLLAIFLESLTILIFSSCHVNIGSIKGLLKVFKVRLFFFTVAKCIFFFIFCRFFYKKSFIQTWIVAHPTIRTKNPVLLDIYNMWCMIKHVNWTIHRNPRVICCSLETRLIPSNIRSLQKFAPRSAVVNCAVARRCNPVLWRRQPVGFASWLCQRMRRGPS